MDLEVNVVDHDGTGKISCDQSVRECSPDRESEWEMVRKDAHEMKVQPQLK